MNPALTAALRACAAGLLAGEAGTGLLISQRTLLAGTLASFTRTTTSPDGTMLAWIEWHAAITALHDGQLPLSGGERRILAIAASLAEGIPVNLADTLTGLDTPNLEHVITAIRHTAGHH